MRDDKTTEEDSLLPAERAADSEGTYTKLTKKGKPKTLLWSLLSLILAILSVAFSIFGWAGVILGVCAIIFSIIGRKGLGFFNGFTIAGLLTGIFGIVFGVAMIILPLIFPDFKLF